MKKDYKPYIKDIVEQLNAQNLNIFAGAGMSVASGFVNWSELLRPIAEELNLDVNKEANNLVAIAQYHYNKNGGRNAINKRLVEEFSQKGEININHKILRRLPIKNYWTTNYDKLIETALNDFGKIVDVKYTLDHLTISKPNRDAILYKMHGDIDHPNEAVLTKDDYEKYSEKMHSYISILKSHLITKTFLFIGLSFTDPNLDYILSRIRLAYKENQKTHYCFMKIISNNGEPDYEYNLNKQDLFIHDLKRFGIKTICVNEYSEITDYLELIENEYKKKNVFIAGAVDKFKRGKEKENTNFISDLSKKLICEKYNVISGFGAGVGNIVIDSVLREIYENSERDIKDRLILKPFTKNNINDSHRKNRENIISQAGTAIFLYGNKLNEQGKKILSHGMKEEFKIAKEFKVKVIPVGITGDISQKLWLEENSLIQQNNKISDEYKNKFAELGNSNNNYQQIIEIIFDLINLNLYK